MRIISGRYRGRRLKTVTGLDVRPTSDRLRETLFNILAPRIRGSIFLDLCAGSGAIGIEALSRGAARATFVDNSRRSIAGIKENLQSLAVRDETRILFSDAVAAIRRLEEEGEKFDIIYFDPPYTSEIYPQVMARLASGSILNMDAIVIIEHRAKIQPEGEYGKLKIYRQLKQGESALAFYAPSITSDD